MTGPGRNFIFRGSSNGPEPPHYVELAEGDTGFGQTLTLGDINGDGSDDVLVGVETAERVYVFIGGSSGVTSTPIIIEAPEPHSEFGASLACD